MGDIRILDQVESVTPVETLSEVGLGWMDHEDLLILENDSKAKGQSSAELSNILDGFEIIDSADESNSDQSEVHEDSIDLVAELPESDDPNTGKTNLEIDLYGISEDHPFVQSIQEKTLDRIPDRIENFLAENGQKLVLADRITSVDDKYVKYFSNFNARNYRDGSRMSDLPAFYAPSGHIVGVMSCPQYDRTDAKNGPTERQIAETAEKLIHETGHAVDRDLKLSSKPGFKAIYDKELAVLRSSNLPNSYYFAGTASETVAELFAYYCEGDAHDTDGSGDLAKLMPESYKWLKERFDAIGRDESDVKS